MIAGATFPARGADMDQPTVAFGPIGISYSRSGGPCRNPPHRGGKRIAGNWYFAGLN